MLSAHSFRSFLVHSSALPRAAREALRRSLEVSDPRAARDFLVEAARSLIEATSLKDVDIAPLVDLPAVCVAALRNSRSLRAA